MRNVALLPIHAAHYTSLYLTIVDYNAGTVKDMGLAQAKGLATVVQPASWTTVANVMYR